MITFIGKIKPFVGGDEFWGTKPLLNQVKNEKSTLWH